MLTMFIIVKKYHLIIYIGINILLLSLLLFGISINGSKCWLFIGPFSFQPSELAKLALILYSAILIQNNNKITKPFI